MNLKFHTFALISNLLLFIMRVLLCGLGSIITNALDFRLRKYGCKVSKAQDANEALNKIHAGQTDVLVTSISVPNFRLTTFIGLVREDIKSDIPIILVSEPEGDLDEILLGIEAGADDFLTFPFKPLELVVRINLLLHRYVNH
jgi:two-component system, OmpR family, response regulator